MNLYVISLLPSVIISYLALVVIENPILKFLKEKNLVQQNYAGNQVLSSGGLLILIPCILSYLTYFLISPSPIMIVFIIMLPVVTFCGMLDDLLGDNLSKGLVGHIRTLLKYGNFSTGLLKAFVGILIGLLVAYTNYSGFYLLILDSLCFALSMNFINLLDLRPGRAIKSFGFLIMSYAVVSFFSDIQFILPALIVLIFYTRGEMQEKYMLGDTGANLLGGILGFYGVIVLKPIIKMLLLILLISIHIFAEFHSLSKTIEDVPLLRKIDMLGRKQSRGEQ